MGLFITAYQRRTTREQITFRDSSGGVATLASTDKIRLKIGVGGAAPLLDIVSGSNLAGGSYVTKSNPAVLELCQEDLLNANIKPGTYNIEALVVDSNDSGRIKLADEGIFVLIATQSGGLS